MAQLRADIQQTENEKKRKYDSEKLKINIASPIIEQNNQDIINLESQEEIKEALENFQNSDDYITNEQDWNED